MSQLQSSKLYALVAVHVVLAIAPLGEALVPSGKWTLPLLWSLASIPLSQLMLLSAWLGMTRGNTIRRIVIAVLATLYIAFWPSLGEFLRLAEVFRRPLPSINLQFTWIMLLFLASLSAVMMGARRFVGTIHFASRSDARCGELHSQYSLIALLAVTTATALILGLVRGSRTGGVDGVTIAQYLLAVVVFVVNILATIWATLGAGHVVRRIAAVYCVSLMLGLSWANGAGYSLDTKPWWLFPLSSLILIVPTTIVVVTLLVIRSLGYRLLPQQELESAEISAE